MDFEGSFAHLFDGYPFYSSFYLFVCLFLSVSLTLSLQFLAAVDLGVLRETGTQRQVVLETIFLRPFLYVIAYLILEVRWFEFSPPLLCRSRRHMTAVCLY